MRMLMKVQIPVEKGNEALRDGSMQKAIQQAMQTMQPEAIYFFAEEGLRTAIAVFDMKQASDMAAMLEPIFQGLNAKIHLTPVMTPDDLQQGLSRLS